MNSLEPNAEKNKRLTTKKRILEQEINLLKSKLNNPDIAAETFEEHNGHKSLKSEQEIREEIREREEEWEEVEGQIRELRDFDWNRT